MLTKGAPEMILALASHEQIDGRASRPLTAAAARPSCCDWPRELAGRALRVLALATRDYPPATTRGPYDEAELTFVGLVGMIDPPRDEAREAVRPLPHAPAFGRS